MLLSAAAEPHSSCHSLQRLQVVCCLFVKESVQFRHHEQSHCILLMLVCCICIDSRLEVHGATIRAVFDPSVVLTEGQLLTCPLLRALPPRLVDICARHCDFVLPLSLLVCVSMNAWVQCTAWHTSGVTHHVLAALKEQTPTLGINAADITSLVGVQQALVGCVGTLAEPQLQLAILQDC